MKYFFYITFIITTLSSCVNYKMTSFDTDVIPSHVQYPEEVQEMKIANRTFAPKIIKINYRSMPGSDETLGAFRQTVHNMRYFNVGGISSIKLIAPQSYTFPQPLNVEEIQDLSVGNYILVTLEVFQIKENTYYQEDRIVQVDTSNGKEYLVPVIRGYKEVTGTAGFRIYHSTTGQILHEEIIRELARYESIEGSEAEARAKLNEMSATAPQELGSILGEQFARYVSPEILRVSRVYYSKSKNYPELKTAQHFIKANDWETAKQVWEDALKGNPDSKDIGKLYHNLAVYHERNGNVEETYRLLMEAAKHQPAIMTRQYIEEYQNRSIGR